MKRIGLYLTQQQYEDLQRFYDKTGINMSEAIRRAVDEFLERKQDIVKGGDKGTDEKG